MSAVFDAPDLLPLKIGGVVGLARLLTPLSFVRIAHRERWMPRKWMPIQDVRGHVWSMFEEREWKETRIAALFSFAPVPDPCLRGCSPSPPGSPMAYCQDLGPGCVVLHRPVAVSFAYKWGAS